MDSAAADRRLIIGLELDRQSVVAGQIGTESERILYSGVMLPAAELERSPFKRLTDL